MSRALFQRVAIAQALLFGVLYLGSVVGFVTSTQGVSARFAAAATGPYLATAIGVQLALIPGYALLALVATLLVAPLVRSSSLRSVRAESRTASSPGHEEPLDSARGERGPPRPGSSPLDSARGERAWWRFGLQVVALDVVLGVLALGPALRRGPGLVDTVARKLPALDLYALYRWHVLEGLSALLAAWVLFAAWRLLHGFGRRVVLAAGLASLLLGAAMFYRPAPPRASKRQQPNVLVLATDSLRFDRLGVHGAAHADITPNLDTFSKAAFDFTNLHVATASTLEAWVTLFTGQLPAAHGIRSMYPSRDEVRAVEENAATLPRLLAASGYDTFVSSDWAGNCFDLVDLGFQRRRVAPVQNFEALLGEATVKAHPLVPLYLSVLPGAVGDLFVPGRAALASLARPEALVDQLFEEIDASLTAQRPFFGVLFVSPTHLPYNARYPFNVKYGDPEYRGAHRYQVEVSTHELITTGFSPTLPPETVQHVRDLYDGAVSDFDDTVGQVLRELEARGLADDTVIIVTTDHGEDLYDPGSTLGHGTNFFGGDQSTRIPFLMRVPGQREGKQVASLTRTVDLAPTLLAMLGQQAPASMQGVDLSPVLRGERAEPDLVAYAETCYLFFPKAAAMTGLSDAERAEVVELSGAEDTLEVDPAFRHNLVLRPEFRERVVAAKDRMVRTTRWKLIEIPGKTRPIRRLYDVSVDPLQTHDLAGQGLAVEQELAALLASPDCRARHE